MKEDGETLLTIQFYFAEEVSFDGPGVSLLIEMAPAEDDGGNPIWVGARDIRRTAALPTYWVSARGL